MEQRNIYRGSPARAWIRLQLLSRVSEIVELEFLVDTGNPCAVIIDESTMMANRWREATQTDSNFGLLTGGWLHITVPETGFDAKMLGYSNDTVASVVKRSDPNFGGLVGLPLLRLFEYGGDAGTFWIRSS
ncbi:MAG: hypothetical protein SGI77_25670 [Pirellulaceae bacterium]|nr:hypothetical protein [Pirellulaceae bacterium]